MRSSLHELQALVSTALLDPQALIPDDLVAWNGSKIDQRFNVYRNNVVSSLIDALAEVTPVVRALVGEEFFRAMAAVFVRASTPQSPCLSRYGDGFPEFIESFVPAKGVPYLSDMARFEIARLRSYHAADAQPIGRGDWGAALARSAGVQGLRVRIHPSVRTLRSAYSVLAIWRAHHDAVDLADTDPYKPESVLMWREDRDVRALHAEELSIQFVEMLMRGHTLSYAAQRVDTPDRPFDLASALRMLVELNVVIEITLDGRIEA